MSHALCGFVRVAFRVSIKIRVRVMHLNGRPDLEPKRETKNDGNSAPEYGNICFILSIH